MQHQKVGNQVRKDQARRLKYQESQRLKQQAMKDSKIALRHGFYSGIELSEGQLKSFTSKLIK